jgi:hypothetical protein
MPDILVTATIADVNGLAEDAIVNAFAFSMPSGFTDYPNLLARVDDFYNAVQVGATQPLAAYMSPSVSRGADSIICRAYDITGHLDGSPHGSPIATRGDTMNSISPGATALPREVACVLTLRGTAWEDMPVEAPDGSDPGTAVDRPKQRHSGRVYFGPLNSIANDTASSRSRPHSQLRSDMLLAAADLADDARALGGQWCVWSRKDEFLYTITDVQVDNAWDTQRRRGEAATLRSTADVSS